MCGSREYVETLSEKEREDIVLMINIDSVLAGDYHYLYGGNVNEHGKVDRAEAVVKAYDIAKSLDWQYNYRQRGISIIHTRQGKKEATMPLSMI